MPAASKHQHISLKKHTVTRWNSVLLMMESLLHLKDPVQEALKRTGHYNLQLTHTDWELLAELTDFLKVFKDLTDLVSGNHAGLSLMPLIRDEISDTVKTSNEDSPSLRELKRRISTNINKRFPMTDAVTLCCILDPSTKDILGLSQEEKVSTLKEAVSELLPEQPESDDKPTDENQCEPMSKKRKLLMKKKCNTAAESHLEEINRYLLCHASKDEEDTPLLFWKKQSLQFPVLSQLARLYLCASVSSVPVECMFSVTGMILNRKRSNLAPYKLNYLSFVHDNYQVFASVMVLILISLCLY